eukprot:4616192-Pyramimonas_sp.AAC.1
MKRRVSLKTSLVASGDCTLWCLYALTCERRASNIRALDAAMKRGAVFCSSTLSSCTAACFSMRVLTA